MTELESEALAAAKAINADICDAAGAEDGPYLVFGSTGFACDVMLSHQQLFCSENDDRRDIGDGNLEPVEDCVRRGLRKNVLILVKALGITASDLEGFK